MLTDQFIEFIGNSRLGLQSKHEDLYKWLL